MTSGQRKFGRGVLGLSVGLAIVIVVFAIVTIGSVRQTQVERLPKAEQNDETLARVVDCTEPGGTCYQRGQRQTAKAVGDISRVIVLTAACAGELPPGLTADERVEAITGCVTARLSRRAPGS